MTKAEKQSTYAEALLWLTPACIPLKFTPDWPRPNADSKIYEANPSSLTWSVGLTLHINTVVHLARI